MPSLQERKYPFVTMLQHCRDFINAWTAVQGVWPTYLSLPCRIPPDPARRAFRTKWAREIRSRHFCGSQSLAMREGAGWIGERQASRFVISERFWLTGILHRRIKCSQPVHRAPGKETPMTRTPILFLPLAIVLTTLIHAPASAWAATDVRFGVNQSLSGPPQASDPDIREVGLAV